MRVATLAVACVLALASSFIAPSRAATNADGEAALDRLLDRIVEVEVEFLDQMESYQPFMETYLQAVGDPADPEQQVDDHYLIGKVTLDGPDVAWESLAVSAAFYPRGPLRLLKLSKRAFEPESFARMIAPDPHGIDRDYYDFEYVRREFLGSVRALVFNLRPIEPDGFIGRIWVEDRTFRIVRFNGTHALGRGKRGSLHFDSWRTETTPGFWAPSFIYVEDEDAEGRAGNRFKAQSRLWNYAPSASSKIEELTAVLIESEAIEDDDPTERLTPLEARRRWLQEAQDNVLDRLEKAGLLAPEGEVDAVLNQVVNNLIATNDLDLEVHCRVLLTTPLETFSIGQAIVISRGLIDVLPDEGALAAALSDELAHIALGHDTETLYGFSDYTIFDDIEVLDRIRMRRPAEEVAAAGAQAAEYLARSPYADELAGSGLFLQALMKHAPRLPNLIEGNLGNELAWGDELLRLERLAQTGPALDESSLEQIAALPLGSRVRLDPWTNQITLLPAQPADLRTAKDKLPFEVTPFMPHLERLRQ